MLNQSLLEIALATCLSSPGLAKKLKSHLLSTNGVSVSPLDPKAFQQECHKLLRADMDADYPRRFRFNDIDHALQVIWPKNMIVGANGGKMPFLDLLYERLFIAHGDHVQYRDGLIQEYVRLAARIDPAVLFTWRLAQRVGEQPTLKPHDLIRIMAAQQAFFSPPAIAGQPVAENHVHLGGAHYTGMILMADLLPAAAPPCEQGTGDACAEMHRLANALLWHGSLLPDESDQNNQSGELASKVRKAVNAAIGMQAATDAPPALPWFALALQGETTRADNPRWQRQQIASCIADEDVGQAWLWFLLWLWTHFQHPHCDARLRLAIFYLLNGLMRIRQDLIMDGQGLSRFVEYYGRQSSKVPEHFAGSAAKTLFQGIEDVTELKVSATRMAPKQIGAWLRHMAKATGLAAPDCARPMSPPDLEKYRRMMDRWHYCVHFIRSKDLLNRPEKVWKQARGLQRQLEAQAGWQHRDMLADADNGGLRLVPSRWLRGLDVAGDENLVKTEIFAPALRWLREGMRSKPDGEPATGGLHFSIHVGEDYAHPLSGMRHIDEAGFFCEMHGGDRLGHALALGIPATEWIAAHGEILLPVEEHLDNLVWAWHYACIMSSRLALATQVLPLLERRIHKMLQYVPWAHGACMEMDASTRKKEGQPGNAPERCPSARRLLALTPEHLFKAWQLRRNCSHQLDKYENQGEIRDRQIEVGLPDLKELTTRCTPLDAFDKGAASAAGTARDTAHAPEQLDYSPAVALYRQRWKWLAQQKGGNAPPEKGCAKLTPIRTVRIRLESNLHDEFKTGSGNESEMNLIDDSHSPQELEFIDALQDWLLDAYDQKGLMIEANPTSNVYIARLTNHAEHPVFRWYPPNDDWLKPGQRCNRFSLRRGPIKVCINTDDPGIMPTTLRTEFALLREAALEHGITRSDAESWLARLRALGLDEFAQKHQSVWVADKVRAM